LLLSSTKGKSRLLQSLNNILDLLLDHSIQSRY
jgi:hypothetical protein